jgi:photosystem II stability/assembly factor-like uncharacterized protein
MNKRITGLWLICLSLLLFSCGDNDAPPAQPTTGWIIGSSVNKDTFISSLKILKTSNGGESWVLQTLPAGCEGFLGNDISAVSHQVAWAAAGHSKDDTPTGGILRTTDGGATWMLQALPDGMITRHIKGIKAVSATEAWAVSLHGDVLHTTDAGVTWQIVEVRTAMGHIIDMQRVNRMDVIGQDIWIVDLLGEDSGVVHSPDGGATWWRESLPDIVGEGHGPLVISAFSSLVAWAGVNSEGNLWWTANGGRSWNKSNDVLSLGIDYDDICASSADVVWVAANGDTFGGGFVARVRVTDGNFESNIAHHPPYKMEGVSAMTDEKAWAVGYKVPAVEPDLPIGAIFYTSDGGVTWQSQPVPSNALDVIFWKVSFVGARR